MADKRWLQIEEIFQRALDLPTSERAAFLAIACADDQTLRGEVEKLLAAYDRAGDFIESPAVEHSPDIFFAQTLPLDAPPEFSDSLIGRRLGAYRLEREIGRGGMGAVFLATRADEVFQKRVAIKLIKQGMDTDFILRRFRTERQILAILEHPHIARLLDGGTTEEGVPYFVMEYVEGQPFNQYCDYHRLTIRERLKLYLKVCDAVNYAHQNLIIHRDLKPGNIMVSADGTPKLLDFGIAKLLSTEAAEITLDQTQTVVRMMTPQYASPEQVRGEGLTPASDVYSLGVMLYELLLGQRVYQFANRSAEEIARVICEQEPELPSKLIARLSAESSTPPLDALCRDRNTSREELQRELYGDLDKIIMKALRKEPHRRYGQVEDFAADIQRFLDGMDISISSEFSFMGGALLEATPEGWSKSLAVLPFKIINPASGTMPDSSDTYLSIGLADSLITRLSRIRRIAVRPTSSVINRNTPEDDSLTVGYALGVDFVIDGHIIKLGNRLRVSTQLVKVRDGSVVWASQFDESPADFLNLQDSISRQVAESIIPQLTIEEQESLVRRGTNNPQAYQAYLRGRHYWHTHTEDGLAKAIVAFHEAISLDPQYGRAYTGVADYYNWLGFYSVMPPAECFAAAKEAATKAIRLEDSLAEAYASLGFTAMVYDWDISESERLFQRAIELNPNYVQAHEWYSQLLGLRGKGYEAIKEMRRAIELDPRSASLGTTFAFSLYYARRPEDALVQLKRALAIEPDYYLALDGLGWVYTQLGKHEEAVAATKQAVEISNRATITLWGQACALAAAGQSGEARRIASELEALAEDRYVPPFYFALIHTRLGEPDAAFAWLEKALAVRDHWLLCLSADPALDPLRGDPRFSPFLKGLQPLSKPAAKDGESELQNFAAEERAQPAPAAPRRFGRRATLLLLLAVALGITSIAYFYMSLRVSVTRDQTFVHTPPNDAMTTSAKTSLVVLPFKAEGEFENLLGIGLADVLTSKLGQIKQLAVRPASAGQQYLVTAMNAQQIGSELQVRYILQGRLRRSNDDLAISAELINTQDGTVVWGESLQDRLGRISAMQNIIADSAARALTNPTESEKQQLAKRYTENSEAYQLYLIGRYHLSKRTVSGITTALDYFEQASKKDAKFALAYAGLADGYGLLNLYQAPPPPDAYLRAKENGKRAIALDEQLAEAHASLAYVLFYHDRNRPKAEQAFRRAIELNPSYATAHHWFAIVLSAMGRQSEALAEIQIAQQLDPRSAIIHSASGMIYYYGRRYTEALADCRHALELDIGLIPAHRVMRWTYQMLGHYDAALQAYQQEKGFSGDEEIEWPMILAQVQAGGGKKEEARQTIQKAAATRRERRAMEALPYETAVAYAMAGELDAAFTWLAKAEATRAHGFNFLQIDPRLDTLRADPRFAELAKKLTS